ncbi:CLIP domain-containing serine protease HP8-like [Galleria mellonella]|uniref:CLIP domain-containing serine protease HP8-like n=1 Tax=Galleria mellonella TaxID=7137 RepID=A0A6J1WI27_GALME|nr:CLIP domain-containing serine protease HP8-like [Galleria mellonella]
MKCSYKLLVVLSVLLVCGSVPSFHIHRNYKKCGVEASSNLIHRNPWLVFLEFHDQSDMIDIRCAGTLIDMWHVVTAAHCVKHYTSKLVARFGEYDVSKSKDCMFSVCADPVVKIEVEEVIVPGGYKNHEYGSDIAILKLKYRAPYTDFIRPVCLPTGPINQNAIFIATGWGEMISSNLYSDTKKMIPLPFCSLDDCRRVYSRINLPDDIICAGGVNGMDTCRGDSGGPLLWIRERVELRGVINTGYSRCGTEGFPGLYISVENHLEWIEAIRNGYYDGSIRLILSLN